ncbi:MAG: hypothetical protein MRECE_7c016 [Mycoplasmataceae bacterium CE_OT135]|nr:MAG: hypothetical protein MRECE_7c016 [Mycoplasmataceae bacterium CE_OT135]
MPELSKSGGNFPGKQTKFITRYTKREYEKRRELFDEPVYDNPAHLADYSYDEWTEWGAQGGRPRQWANDAERKRAKRAQQKLVQGLPLTYQEKELLGLMKKRPGAYRTNLGRPMTPAERKAKWKAARKGGNM